MTKDSSSLETLDRDAAIPVVVNGERTMTAARTLDALLLERDVAGAHVATALNGRFVPVRERGMATLASDDAVEIVSARPGG